MWSRQTHSFGFVSQVGQKYNRNTSLIPSVPWVATKMICAVLIFNSSLFQIRKKNAKDFHPDCCSFHWTDMNPFWTVNRSLKAFVSTEFLEFCDFVVRRTATHFAHEHNTISASSSGLIHLFGQRLQGQLLQCKQTSPSESHKSEIKVCHINFCCFQPKGHACARTVRLLVAWQSRVTCS